MRITGLALLLLLLFSANAAFASVLVLVPHPDDEALMFAGIIHAAVQRGEPVKLVVMTNGDLNGAQLGYTREAETVEAMAHLGLQESEILFLGFPDGGLRRIYDQFTDSSSIYVSAAGKGFTYGNRGSGGKDYNSWRFGEPGKYNRPTILLNLKTILSEYQPQDIYTAGEYDTHLDHSATYYYLRLALASLAADSPGYRPTIHKTYIHAGNDSIWPLPTDAVTPFSEFPLLGLMPLAWSSRECALIPDAMQRADAGTNLKEKVIGRYKSQYIPYLLKFVHRDEIFWRENLYDGNRAPAADAGENLTVSAGSAVTLSGQQSFDADNDRLTYFWTQLQGLPVVLSDRTSATPAFTAPALTDDLVFQLIVNDGKTSSFPATVTIRINYGKSLLSGIYRLLTGFFNLVFNFGGSKTYNATIPSTQVLHPISD